MLLTGNFTGRSTPLRSSLRPCPDSTIMGAVTRNSASWALKFSWNMSFTALMAFSVCSGPPSRLR